MSERFRPPVEQTELLQSLPEAERLFGLREDTDERAAEIEDAVRTGDTQRLIELLGNRQVLENLLLQKGDGMKFVRGLITGTDAVARELSGMRLQDIHNPADVSRLVKDGLSPFALAEASGAFFHLKRTDETSRLAQAIMQADDIHPVARAMAANNMGSLLARHENYRGSSEVNKRGLDILRDSDLSEDDPNRQWARLKILHGLVWNRFKVTPHADMADRFLTIADERSSFDQANQYRAVLDAARVARDSGDVDRAIYLMQQAAAGLEAQSYWSAQEQALEELAAMHMKSGDAGKGRRMWVKGIGLGDRMRSLRAPELRGSREAEIAVPVRCLVDVGDGRYLIDEYEFDGEQRFGLPVVDQEHKRKKAGVNPDTIIRDKLAGLVRLAAMDAGAGDAVPLTGRKIRLFKSKARTTEDHAVQGVSVRIHNEAVTAALAGVDKLPESGYVLLDWDSLQTVLHLFDAESQALLQKEQARREKKAKGS